ncbi:hypothetical protein H072_7063 [Dactylellina haptotyla CBS 200.50]|uniref:Serine protease n=1 Tax=Dactylellina haptotyla (strain CBS 200.50) TaxID=1284197 RepID=S8BIL5_DACHA|nr:hypothetical protein H072_7063 [Dactylellina haptotyla CBS 200.50]
MEKEIVDYYATIRSKGALSPPTPEDLSIIRCEDKGATTRPCPMSREQLAISNFEQIEMFERQSLSKYLDTIFEDYGTCPPVIPIAARFRDTKAKRHYTRATAWAFGVNYLFTCYHSLEEKEIIDSESGEAVSVELEEVYWSDFADPRQSIGTLEVVASNPTLDIAILRTKERFHRLVLQKHQPLYYSKLYTVQILSVPHPVVHPGRFYPSPSEHTFLTDTRSTDGFSGSPVLTASGHVIGMVRGEWNDVNVMVVTTQGLLTALQQLEGSSDGGVNWERWGVKGCLGCPKPATPPQAPSSSRFIDTRLLKTLRRRHDDWKGMLEQIEKSKEYHRQLERKKLGL